MFTQVPPISIPSHRLILVFFLSIISTPISNSETLGSQQSWYIYLLISLPVGNQSEMIPTHTDALLTLFGPRCCILGHSLTPIASSAPWAPALVFLSTWASKSLQFCYLIWFVLPPLSNVYLVLPHLMLGGFHCLGREGREVKESNRKEMKGREREGEQDKGKTRRKTYSSVCFRRALLTLAGALPVFVCTDCVTAAFQPHAISCFYQIGSLCFSATVWFVSVFSTIQIWFVWEIIIIINNNNNNIIKVNG